jgi:Transcriptional activator of glycolytic enzymes
VASQQLAPPAVDPPHCMSRQTTTVRQLHTKWYAGLGGKPSVVQMDHHFGTKWRTGSGDREKVFYSTRKTIIDHIEHRCRSGEDLDAILDHLQGVMARNKGLQALSFATRSWRNPGPGRRTRIGTRDPARQVARPWEARGCI